MDNNVEWQPPEEDYIKINCDGACNAKVGKVAIGVVARNKDNGWDLT